MRLSCWRDGELVSFGVGDVVRVLRWLSPSTVFVVSDVAPSELILDGVSRRRRELLQLPAEEVRHVLNAELVEP